MNRAGFGEILDEAIAARERGEGVVIATVVASRLIDSVSPGARLLVHESGDIRGHIHRALDPVLRQDALRSLQERRSRSRSYAISEKGARSVGVEGGNVDVFFEVLGRPPHLVIVGAGHIAVPLARTAKLLEFKVTVLDDRPEYATVGRFPDADEIVVGRYAETLARVPIDSDTYVVLVTRGHVHDQACLEQVLDSPAAYIGMIGSKRRVRTVIERARERGHDVAKLKRVFAPIGLDIAAETPAEIALAIMAEIVNMRRGGRAPSMTVGTKLHA